MFESSVSHLIKVVLIINQEEPGIESDLRFYPQLLVPFVPYPILQQPNGTGKVRDIFNLGVLSLTLVVRMR